MVETVEGVGKIINIGTDLVRRDLLKGILHHAVETGNLQHQRFLAVVGCLVDGDSLQAVSGLLIFVQDGFDPDDRVQDIRTGISLEGSESVKVKDIILAGLVGKIAVFDGGKAYNLRRSLLLPPGRSHGCP